MSSSDITLLIICCYILKASSLELVLVYRGENRCGSMLRVKSQKDYEASDADVYYRVTHPSQHE